MTCSLVSAEPSARGCGVFEICPVGRHAQRFPLHALEPALQHALGAGVDEAGKALFEGAVQCHAVLRGRKKGVVRVAERNAPPLPA